MSAHNNHNNGILDMFSYIEEYFKEFKFDTHNRKLIKNLGLWATRDPKFNNLESGWHVDRGILLMGVPGVGKDVILRILKSYMSYQRSQYAYQSRVVWEYSEKFMKEKSASVLNDVGYHNCYYEELARTDEKITDKFGKELPLTCSIEDVQSFGNKLLVGAQLINVRYNIFVQGAFQSHFSTNCNELQLRELYGLRVTDRLAEMCNFMVLSGESKRGKVPPQFVRNKMAYTPPPARETTVDEHKENKEILEAEYKMFLETGQVSATASINFYILRSYNCAVSGDEELRRFMELAEEDYVAPHVGFKSFNREAHKTNFQWDQARKVAVIKFYTNLKKEGANTIFGIVDVPVDKIVRSVVSENKSQQQ